MTAGLQRVDAERFSVDYLVYRHGRMFWDASPIGAVRMRADYAERVRLGLRERGELSVVVWKEEMRGAVDAGCSGGVSESLPDTSRRLHCIPMEGRAA